MGVNAYTSNLNVRERQSTYVPLPFQEMYAALQERQKRYDAAEAYERLAKKEISALSSPIADHNEYLEKNIKQPFLQQAIALHNSIPDKGSSEYKRKLNDLVDATTSNPNLNTITQSSLEWEKFVKTSAEMMAKGNYSNAAARMYKNFKGFNEDGTINKFQFAGLRAVKDVDGMINDIIAKTPIQETSSDVTTIEGKRTASATKIKTKDIIYSGLSTTFYNDPELLADAMDKFNITDPKEFDKILRIKAKDGAIKHTSTINEYNVGLMKRQDDIAAAKAFEQQSSASPYNLGTYDDDYNSKILKQVENFIDVNGNIRPATPTTFNQANRPSEETYYNLEQAGWEGSVGYKGNLSLTSTASAKERMAYSKKKLLENPQFKAMVDNYMHAGLNQDAAIKRAGQELRKMPFAKKNYEGRIITDKNEREVLQKTMQGLGGMLSFYDKDNPTKSGALPLETVLEQSGEENLANLDVGAEIAPVAGVSGNQNYMVTLGKKTFIVSMDSPYFARNQSKVLFDAERTKSPVRLKRYVPGEDDNLNHDALKQDAMKYGFDDVIIYTGVDGKLHLKTQK
jgi:hypothetical protein